MRQPGGRRLRYALGKAGGLKRRLLGRGPAPREMEGQTAVVEAYWQPIRAAYSGPLRDYTPKRYLGRVHLLIGAETPMGPWLDPRMRWRKLAGGGAEVRVVPGDHTDMLREPNVSALAREIEDCLRRARAGAEATP
jgi:thioesterase domain-containing protein